MLCVRIPQFEAASFIAPAETIKAALSLNKRIEEISVSSLLIAGISFTPIDGKYPEWRRIVPIALNGEMATFDPDLLARAKAAWKDMGANELAAASVRIGYNGEAGALMAREESEALAVIMPVRTRTKIEGKWVDIGANPVEYAVKFLKSNLLT